MNFNDAPKQKGFDLIPAKTIVKCSMGIKPGGYGEGGWYRASKYSDALMLDCEFTITEGEYAKRKFWQLFVMSGGKLDDNGNSIAGNISRQTLRAILESMRNIDPEDMSPKAVKSRQIEDWSEIQGGEFVCRLKIEKNEQFGDQNKILNVITPNMKEYRELMNQVFNDEEFKANSKAIEHPKHSMPVPDWAK